MKKAWLLVLLVSVGLNLGLGVRLMQVPTEQARNPDQNRSQRHAPRWERPAPGDTTAWHRFMGRRLSHLAERLNLRPDQVEHFQQAEQARYSQLGEFRRRLLVARTQLRDLLAAPEIDRAAVRVAIAELGRAQAAMDSLATETVLGELEVLDPEQRVLYLDFLPDGGGRRGGRGRMGH